MTVSGRPKFLVYLDWNVIQYLRSKPEANPLLESLCSEELRERAIVPYSPSHLLDMTALWSATSPEHRLERLRNGVFLDGITTSILAEYIGVGAARTISVTRSSALDEANSRVMFSERFNTDAAESPEFKAVVEHACRTADDMRSMRDAVAANGLDPAYADELAALVESMIDEGVPSPDRAGSLVAGLLSIVFRATSGMSKELGRTLNALRPGDVVPTMNAFFAGRGLPDIGSIAENIASSREVSLDEVGPMVLGMFGYRTDSAKSLRNRKPGILADLGHGAVAVNADVFITGDERLHDRVQAWTEWRSDAFGRQKPLCLLVAPGEIASFTAAAEALSAFVGCTRIDEAGHNDGSS